MSAHHDVNNRFRVMSSTWLAASASSKRRRFQHARAAPRHLPLLGSRLIKSVNAEPGRDGQMPGNSCQSSCHVKLSPSQADQIPLTLAMLTARNRRCVGEADHFNEFRP